MNVTTSSTTSATVDFSSTQSSSSKSVSNQKTVEKSFDETMKNSSKTEETKDTSDTKDTEKSSTDSKTQNKDSETVSKGEKNIDKSIVPLEDLNGEVSFTDFKYHNESQSLLSRNIQSLLDTKDLMNFVSLASTIDYDVLNMSDADADFFANLVQKTDMSMNGIMNQIGNELIENNQNVQRSVQISSVLMEKLSESMNTNKPFRIDFDKDISVIIRVNKDGSLSANFIPGDKAVEQYLRNNISSLKQRFDDENLPYSELTYSNSKNGQQQRRNKENDNE